MRFLSVTTALLACALLLQAEDKKEGPDAETTKHIRTLEALRGLKFKKEPSVKYWDEEKLKKMMIEDFDEELPEKKAKQMETTLVKFGLIPEDYDLRKEYLDLLVEQIAGFYHPKKKLLCLIKGKSGSGIEQDIIVIHELNHAMQDQHFDLTRLQDLAKKNDDMSMALSSLVEGEATYIMMDHATQSTTGMSIDDVPGIETMMDSQMRSGDPRAKKLNEAPLLIREGLLRPYIDGFKFCIAVKKAKGWDGMNAMYEDLPTSTEQILHPEKYINRDMPQLANLPKQLDALQGWEKTDTNTMGEFGVMMVFHTLKPKSPKSGREASEGWDGDSFVVYTKGESVLLAWATAWDTEVDAKEFATAYQKILKKKYEGLDDLETKGKSVSMESESGQVAMTVAERKVFIVEGGTKEEAEAVLKQLEEETEFEEVKKGFGKK